MAAVDNVAGENPGMAGIEPLHRAPVHANRRQVHRMYFICSRRRMRSSVEGCVENRFVRPPPENGFTMNRCAVLGVASASGMRCDHVSSLPSAEMSSLGLWVTSAEVWSAAYSRVREMAI